MSTYYNECTHGLIPLSCPTCLGKRLADTEAELERVKAERDELGRQNYRLINELAERSAEVGELKAERDAATERAEFMYRMCTEAQDLAKNLQESNRQESAAMAALLEKAERTLSERNTELLNTQDLLETERDLVKRIWEASGAENGKSIVEQIANIKAERDALVMAVGNKYPNETRFETALRYIRQAENQEMLGSAKDAARGRE